MRDAIKDLEKKQGGWVYSGSAFNQAAYSSPVLKLPRCAEETLILLTGGKKRH